MAAPDLRTLLDFEGQWDDAIPLAFKDRFKFLFVPEQSVDPLVVPRCQFRFQLTDPAGPGSDIQKRAAPEAGSSTARHFTLNFLFVTDRHTDSEKFLRGLRGDFRAAMLPPAADDGGLFNSTTLPWLEVLALGETRAARGSLPGREGEKRLDTWETNWEGMFNIRDDAWPA